MVAAADLFPGFQSERIAVAGAEIAAVIGGSGPPLLLLHGFPQNFTMWHRVAPALARDFTVIAADLRGYGDSSVPATVPDHASYSFRAMAQDQAALMTALGFERYLVCGHDRGARVTHRMALDHPQRVIAAAILDIVPTLYHYENVTREFATGYYHWFFFIQPFDFPERLIGANPDYFLDRTFGRIGRRDAIDPRAIECYARAFRDPARLHAMMEDYRAGASIDLEHDRADRGRKLACPVLVMWGEKGVVGRNFDVLDIWRGFALDVRGGALPCGHYLAEEEPEATATRLLQFFSKFL
ncbi:MAG TPA: alpha/beta hydrolase [Dongiaceae bacterium]